MNSLHQAPPRHHLVVWDQTPNNVGRVLMGNLRDPAFPALPGANQRSFITRTQFGLLEVSAGGWNTPRRLNVNRVYLILREAGDFDPESMEVITAGSFRFIINMLVKGLDQGFPKWFTWTPWGPF